MEDIESILGENPGTPKVIKLQRLGGAICPGPDIQDRVAQVVETLWDAFHGLSNHADRLAMAYGVTAVTEEDRLDIGVTKFQTVAERLENAHDSDSGSSALHEQNAQLKMPMTPKRQLLAQSNDPMSPEATTRMNAVLQIYGAVMRDIPDITTKRYMSVNLGVAGETLIRRAKKSLRLPVLENDTADVEDDDDMYMGALDLTQQDDGPNDRTIHNDNQEPDQDGDSMQDIQHMANEVEKARARVQIHKIAKGFTSSPASANELKDYILQLFDKLAIATYTTDADVEQLYLPHNAALAANMMIDMLCDNGFKFLRDATDKDPRGQIFAQAFAKLPTYVWSTAAGLFGLGILCFMPPSFGNYFDTLTIPRVILALHTFAAICGDRMRNIFEPLGRVIVGDVLNNRPLPTIDWGTTFNIPLEEIRNKALESYP